MEVASGTLNMQDRICRTTLQGWKMQDWNMEDNFVGFTEKLVLVVGIFARHANKTSTHVVAECRHKMRPSITK